MAFLDDNTSVVRMKRDFDQFVQDQNDGRDVPIFSLDNIGNDSFNSRSGDSDALSVRTLLGKIK